MATVLKKTDVAIVGFGWVGAIMAKELTEAGLNVVALERGPMRDTWPDGAYPQVIDELTYNIRRKLFQDLSKSTVTIRHNTSQQAVPYRQLAAFLPGTGVGGAGLHWSGVHFRVDPIELRMRSHYEERYGKTSSPDMIIRISASPTTSWNHSSIKRKKYSVLPGPPGRSKARSSAKAAAATPSPRTARTTSRCRRRKNTGRRSCLKKRRWKWGITPITCRRPTPPTPIPTPTARRWARATSAVSAAATPATCTLKLRRT